LLHQRRLCTREALADLFDVSPRTIGTTLLEVRPLLEQHGYLPTPVAGPRFSTAAALLAFVTATTAPDTGQPSC
jgi:hypothetical protein